MKINYEDAFNNFFKKDLINFSTKVINLLSEKPDSRIYFFGNGASAAISSHLANDFTKALKRKAATFHDPSLLTCFGNDYGYDQWIRQAIIHFCETDDIAIFISSSGKSSNIINGIKQAKKNKLKIISLVGPNPDEVVKESSDIFLSINSNLYNEIECIHMTALCYVVDLINPVTLK